MNLLIYEYMIYGSCFLFLQKIQKLNKLSNQPRPNQVTILDPKCVPVYDHGLKIIITFPNGTQNS